MSGGLGSRDSWAAGGGLSLTGYLKGGPGRVCVLVLACPWWVSGWPPGFNGLCLKCFAHASAEDQCNEVPADLPVEAHPRPRPPGRPQTRRRVSWRDVTPAPGKSPLRMNRLPVLCTAINTQQNSNSYVLLNNR